MIDLSIVLLSWNGRDLALACLDSIDRTLRAASGAQRLSIETILVDNGSADGTVEAVRTRFPWAGIVELASNRGFAGGNNAGIAQARGRHVCLLNNDTIVQPGALEACVRYLDAHPDVGVVGPQLLHDDGRRQNSIHNFPTLLLELVPRSLLEIVAPRRYPSKRFVHRAPLDVEAVLGACMVVRRSVIERVGPMPEDFFFFLEETDWCFAMRDAGHRVVHLPEAHIVHLHGASTKKVVPLPTRIEYHRSLYHFFHKRRGSVQTGLVVLLRVLKLVAALVVLTPAALLMARERERWRQRAWILVWHLAGMPGAWGLAGVRAAAPSVGAA